MSFEAAFVNQSRDRSSSRRRAALNTPVALPDAAVAHALLAQSQSLDNVEDWFLSAAQVAGAKYADLRSDVSWADHLEELARGGRGSRRRLDFLRAFEERATSARRDASAGRVGQLAAVAQVEPLQALSHDADVVAQYELVTGGYISPEFLTEDTIGRWGDEWQQAWYERERDRRAAKLSGDTPVGVTWTDQAGVNPDAQGSVIGSVSNFLYSFLTPAGQVENSLLASFTPEVIFNPTKFVSEVGDFLSSPSLSGAWDVFDGTIVPVINIAALVPGVGAAVRGVQVAATAGRAARGVVSARTAAHFGRKAAAARMGLMNASTAKQAAVSGSAQLASTSQYRAVVGGYLRRRGILRPPNFADELAALEVANEATRIEVLRRLGLMPRGRLALRAQNSQSVLLRRGGNALHTWRQMPAVIGAKGVAQGLATVGITTGVTNRLLDDDDMEGLLAIGDIEGVEDWFERRRTSDNWAEIAGSAGLELAVTPSKLFSFPLLGRGVKTVSAAEDIRRAQSAAASAGKAWVSTNPTPVAGELVEGIRTGARVIKERAKPRWTDLVQTSLREALAEGKERSEIAGVSYAQFLSNADTVARVRHGGATTDADRMEALILQLEGHEEFVYQLDSPSVSEKWDALLSSWNDRVEGMILHEARTTKALADTRALKSARGRENKLIQDVLRSEGKRFEDLTPEELQGFDDTIARGEREWQSMERLVAQKGSEAIDDADFMFAYNRVGAQVTDWNWQNVEDIIFNVAFSEAASYADFLKRRDAWLLRLKADPEGVGEQLVRLAEAHNLDALAQRRLLVSTHHNDDRFRMAFMRHLRSPEALHPRRDFVPLHEQMLQKYSDDAFGEVGMAAAVAHMQSGVEHIIGGGAKFDMTLKGYMNQTAASVTDDSLKRLGLGVDFRDALGEVAKPGVAPREATAQRPILAGKDTLSSQDLRVAAVRIEEALADQMLVSNMGVVPVGRQAFDEILAAVQTGGPVTFSQRHQPNFFELQRLMGEDATRKLVEIVERHPRARSYDDFVSRVGQVRDDVDASLKDLWAAEGLDWGERATRTLADRAELLRRRAGFRATRMDEEDVLRIMGEKWVRQAGELNLELRYGVGWTDDVRLSEVSSGSASVLSLIDDRATLGLVEQPAGRFGRIGRAAVRQFIRPSQQARSMAHEHQFILSMTREMRVSGREYDQDWVDDVVHDLNVLHETLYSDVTLKDLQRIKTGVPHGPLKAMQNNVNSARTAHFWGDLKTYWTEWRQAESLLQGHRAPVRGALRRTYDAEDIKLVHRALLGKRGIGVSLSGGPQELIDRIQATPQLYNLLRDRGPQRLEFNRSGKTISASDIAKAQRLDAYGRTGSWVPGAAGGMVSLIAGTQIGDLEARDLVDDITSGRLVSLNTAEWLGHFLAGKWGAKAVTAPVVRKAVNSAAEKLPAAMRAEFKPLQRRSALHPYVAGARPVVAPAAGAVVGGAAQAQNEDASGLSILLGAGVGAGAGAGVGKVARTVQAGKGRTLFGAAYDVMHDKKLRSGAIDWMGWMYPSQKVFANLLFLRFAASPVFDASRAVEAHGLLHVGLSDEIVEELRHVQGGVKYNPKKLREYWVDEEGLTKQEARLRSLEERIDYESALQEAMGWGANNRNFDDLEARRFSQAGILGFRQESWESSLYHQLKAIGMDRVEAAERTRRIFQYGVNPRSPAELTMNAVFFPFSFTKKTAGHVVEHLTEEWSRAVLLSHNLQLYENLDERYDLNQVLQDRVPVLQQLDRLNQLGAGFQLGRAGGVFRNAADFFAGTAARPFTNAATLGVHLVTPWDLTIRTPDDFDEVRGLLERLVPAVNDIKHLSENLESQVYGGFSSPHRMTEDAEARVASTQYSFYKRVGEEILKKRPDLRADVRAQLGVLREKLVEEFPGYKSALSEGVARAAELGADDRDAIRDARFVVSKAFFGPSYQPTRDELDAMFLRPDVIDRVVGSVIGNADDGWTHQQLIPTSEFSYQQQAKTIVYAFAEVLRQQTVLYGDAHNLDVLPEELLDSLQMKAVQVAEALPYAQSQHFQAWYRKALRGDLGPLLYQPTWKGAELGGVDVAAA